MGLVDRPACQSCVDTVRILCNGAWSSRTGYAWEFIGGLFAGVANRLAPSDVELTVAFRKLDGGVPPALSGSAAKWIEHWIDPTNADETLRLIRHRGIDLLYLTDFPAACSFYAAARKAGVRAIIIHDHTSGDRTVRRGLARLLKYATIQLSRGRLANRVIGVSAYVSRRQIESGLVPADRVSTILNGIAVTALPPATGELRRICNVSVDRPILICSCRPADEKGVNELLCAFDLAVARLGDRTPRPVLAYIGGKGSDDGDFVRLRHARETLASRNDIHFLGWRSGSETRSLIGDADIGIVPSKWQEAFCLSALEPMAYGKPVIATTVGAIPEIVQHEVTGLLVAPADVEGMANAIIHLLSDRTFAAGLGMAGLRRAREMFDLEPKIDALTDIIAAELGIVWRTGDS